MSAITINKKAILTHFLFILGFVILTVIIYYPFFIDGKQVSQHDVLQALGTNQQMKEYRSKTGEEPLWNNAMFSGMPAYLSGVQYSGDLMQKVYQVIKLGMPHPEGITFLSFVSFYILLLSFRVRPWIAFAGAIAFGLNGFNIISITAGHNAKIAAVSLMPLVLAGIHLAFSGKRWLGIGLTALALALQINTNHPQMTYYLLIITLIYGLFQLIYAVQNKSLKPFLLSLTGLVLVALLAVGANIGKLWTVYEYGKVSIRGKTELASDDKSSGLDREYAFRYSNSIFEPLFLFIPNFFGGSSTQELDEKSATAKALSRAGYDRMQIREQIQAMPTYWGDQPMTAPYYAGSLVVFLFVLGLFLLDKKEKTWLIVVAIIGVVLSWGSNFSALNDFLFNYLPGYNKFRSVTFTIIMTILALNIVGFLGLEKIWRKEIWDKAMAKKVFMATAITGGFALLMVIGAGMLSYKGAIDARLPEWLIGALREDRESLLRSDAFRALFFILAFVALLWARWKGKLGNTVVIGGLVFLIFLDVFTLSRRFLNEDVFKKNPVRSFFAPTEADLYIQKNSDSGERVLNLQNPFNEARTSYFHESIGGYHGAKIRRYQDLIDKCISQEMNSVIEKLRAGKRGFSEIPVLNMLNTKFLVAGSSRNAVIENPNALGNAWVVNEILTADSPDEEISLVCTIDPEEEVVIDKSRFDIPNVSKNASGSITLKERNPNNISYTATISGDALGVFSEVYYKNGWKAYVDGKETPILRVNYVLRALPLSSGEHTIKFIFEPKSYYVGNTIMLICSILVILVFIGGIVLEAKSEKRTKKVKKTNSK